MIAFCRNRRVVSRLVGSAVFPAALAFALRCGSGSAGSSRINVTIEIDPNLALNRITVDATATNKPNISQDLPPPTSASSPSVHWTIIVLDLKAPLDATIVASGFKSSGATAAVTSSAVAHLLPGATVDLTLRLDATCTDVMCAADKTCDLGTCIARPVFGGTDGGTDATAGAGGAGAAGGTVGTGGHGGTGGSAGGTGGSVGGTGGSAGGTGGSVGGTGGSAGGTGGCDGGSCACSAPNTRCPDVCTNLASDINNCTACGTICLPPPANGHAICQGTAGCGIQCDSGHLMCGKTCCDTPPSNAFATCSASTCGVQCNSGNHACNGTSSPCYDDTDVTHCGASCTDCRQPNATPVCNVGQCANICNGTTLACPGVGGHVVCGTWDFESGTVEGWSNSSGTWSHDGSDGMFGVSTKRASFGSTSLAITHDNPTGVFTVSAIKVHLCPTGVPIDLSTKSLSFSFYFEPSVGGTLDSSDSDFQYVLWNGANNTLPYYLDDGMSLPPGQWLTRSASLAPPTGTGFTSITDIEIELDTSNKPWVGTLYFDNFRVQ